MKSVLLSLLVFCLANHASAYSSTQSILISSFDPFNKAPANNSFLIAQKVVQALKVSNPNLFVKHCELRTVYDKASESLKDCFHGMAIKPQMVISLGEGPCGGVKFETRAHNLDNIEVEDNDGVVRKNSRIVKDGDKELALSLAIHKAFCSLTKKEKKFVVASNDPGNFVCNNTSYHMSSFSQVENIPFGFIHVPKHSCIFGKKKINKSISIITKVIKSLIQESEISLQPTNRVEVIQRIGTAKRSCEKDFYHKLLKSY